MKRCTCRDEACGGPPCAAEYHHWQAILEAMSADNARIEWPEDDLSRETVCLCKACQPGADIAAGDSADKDLS